MLKDFLFCSYFSSLGGRLKAKKVICCKIIYEDSDKGNKNFMTCLDLDF